MILIDGGSTHNFIKASVAKQLSLPMIQIPTFGVVVGSGDSIECNAKCVGLCLQIQCHEFKVDTYVLDLRGADVVLGVQWMMGLGEIRTNYRHLTMNFSLNRKPVSLQGERLLKPGAVNSRTLKKMVATDFVALFFHLHVVEEIDTQPEKQSQQPEVQALIQRYQHVFEEPKQLAPIERWIIP